MFIRIFLVVFASSLAQVDSLARITTHRTYQMLEVRGLVEDARNLLSLADWRNVGIGLHGNQRSGILFSRKQDDVEVDLKRLSAEEIELQTELHYIEAVEQRNEAQIMSFIDEKHQWESQSEEDRRMLLKKPYIVLRLEEVRSLLAKARTTS